MELIENQSVIRGLENAQLIFDWCKMEWEYDGKYGVWDEDFRYDVYSMFITRMNLDKVRRYGNETGRIKFSKQKPCGGYVTGSITEIRGRQGLQNSTVCFSTIATKDDAIT